MDGPFGLAGGINPIVPPAQPSPPGLSISTSAFTPLAGLSLLGTGGTGVYRADGSTLNLTGNVFSIASGGVGTTQLAASGVTYAKMQNEATVTLLGNPTGSPAAPSEITLGAGLSFSGSTLKATGPAADPLTTKGDLWSWSSTDARVPVGTNGKILIADSAQTAGVGYSTIALDAGSHLIHNVTDPAVAQDAATKNYVDLAVAALAPKNDVQAATTTGLAAYTYNNVATPPSGVGATITLTVAAVLVLDGYTPALGDRLLIKNETGGNAPYNGIYTLTTVGVLGVTNAVLTRSLDFDAPGDGINGALVAVLNGTVNATTLWLCSTAGSINFGTTNITWAKFTGTTYSADGTTLTLTGTTFSIAAGGVGTTQIAANAVTYAKMQQVTNNRLLGNTSGGTANVAEIALPLVVANGGTAVTSVTTAPAATAWAGWDANSNLSANNLIEGYATTVTSSTPVTLAVGSAYQQYFTGSTAQTLNLPVANTLVLGQQFQVINNSSAVVTVKSSGGNTVLAQSAATIATYTCILASGTGTASWSVSYTSTAAVGTVTSVIAGTGLSGGTITGTGTISLTNPVAVNLGGTGLAALTAHTLLIGNGTGNVTLSAVGATNTVLHGNTGADPTYSAVVEADITLADNTTNNVTSTAHGFAPKSPGDATKFLNGAATPTWTVPAFSIDGLSQQQIGLTDELPFYSENTAANQKTTTALLAGICNPMICDFRLSAQPSVAVPATDQTSVGTLWMVPYFDDGSSDQGYSTYPYPAAPTVHNNTSAKGTAGFTLTAPTITAGDTLLIFIVSASAPTLPTGFTLAKNQGDLYYYIKTPATGSEGNVTVSTAGAAYYFSISNADSYQINSILFSFGNISASNSYIAFAPNPASSATNYLQFVVFGSASTTAITAPAGNTDYTGQTQGTLSIDVSTGAGLTAATYPTAAGTYIVVTVPAPPVGRIALFNVLTSQWQLYAIPQISLSLTAVSGNVYDVFCGLSLGTPILIIGTAWTSTTSRGAYLSLVDGVPHQLGTANRWLGSFYANGTNSTEDSKANRLIFNVQNRVQRSMQAIFGSSTWAYTLLTRRAANNSTTPGTYSFNVLCGVPTQVVEAEHQCVFTNASSSVYAGIGIGINSTSVESSQIRSSQPTETTNLLAFSNARYKGAPGLGLMNFQCLEESVATGTTTWNHQGSTVGTVNGMVATTIM